MHPKPSFCLGSPAPRHLLSGPGSAGGWQSRTGLGATPCMGTGASPAGALPSHHHTPHSPPPPHWEQAQEAVTHTPPPVPTQPEGSILPLLLLNTQSSSSLLRHDAPMGHIQPMQHRSATGCRDLQPALLPVTLWSAGCFSPHRQPNKQPLHDGGQHFIFFNMEINLKIERKSLPNNKY